MLFRIVLRLDPERAYSHHYLAFNLDWFAEEAARVEFHYQEAIRLQPTHPWWWSRWICYLATCGRFKEARDNWRKAVDALSISEDSPDWIFRWLHRWVARWLLHWAKLDFAEEVLRSIPTELTESDTSIQALWDLLTALREAERGLSVFPLSVPAREWWSGPHTDLPKTWGEYALGNWMPARIEGIDQDSSVAYIVAAKRPSGDGQRPRYFEMELTRDQVLSGAYGFEWDDLHEGAMIELGQYGDPVKFERIGLHRETTWNGPHLLPLVPPPDRWYQRAVKDAWADRPETD